VPVSGAFAVRRVFPAAFDRNLIGSESFTCSANDRANARAKEERMPVKQSVCIHPLISFQLEPCKTAKSLRKASSSRDTLGPLYRRIQMRKMDTFALA